MTDFEHFTQLTAPPLSEALEKIMKGCHSDPFKVLGCHPDGKNILVRAYLPQAAKAWIGAEHGG
jgi:1,4-alpha-glucan branching enzyme